MGLFKRDGLLTNSPLQLGQIHAIFWAQASQKVHSNEHIKAISVNAVLA